MFKWNGENRVSGELTRRVGTVRRGEGWLSQSRGSEEEASGDGRELEEGRSGQSA